MVYHFPFGEVVNRVEQTDRRPVQVFVLGVYASAVHARWVYQGRTVCRALAVASEPSIFWDGNPEEAQRIIERIDIPSGAGSLRPAAEMYNGPSAEVLDNDILRPLGLTRGEAWLCDLLPESRLNRNQQKVITEKYNPLIPTLGLNPVAVPVDNKVYCDAARRSEILAELLASKAEVLVTLGDYPIKQFLRAISSFDCRDLNEYTGKYGYGKPTPIRINGHTINVLPLAHPRQIGRLGESSRSWYVEHRSWAGQG